MTRLLIFTLLFVCASAAAGQWKAILGAELVISLGHPVSSWERVIDGKKQIMQICTPKVHEEDCHKWVDETGNVVGWGASIRPNGQLVIKKVTFEDAGDYSTPDDKSDPRTIVSLVVERR
ncbi:hypothetical protein PFISCL1PPCAC_24585 [Pristionchus fissidentatus]|uniref:Uncharacterized protein n=1 Tax=Pristionchus fissidentatus TaxID=1538716 RepID=A0AAV5WPH8_9BILA|nr:hypothetical protein PFISCL1PPCAC_24585 [Pristionchus fissidentatus]